MTVPTYPGTSRVIPLRSLQLSRVPSAWRTVQGLPRLGADMCTALQQAAAAPLTTEEGGQKAVAAVEDICALVAAELRRQGLSDEQDSWLWLHGPIVMRQVRTVEILRMDLLRD